MTRALRELRNSWGTRKAKGVKPLFSPCVRSGGASAEKQRGGLARFGRTDAHRRWCLAQTSSFPVVELKGAILRA